MDRKKLDDLLGKRGLQISALNRELLLYSEFKGNVDWDEQDQKVVKKAFEIASRKVSRNSCTTEAEEQFYADAIEQLSPKVKNLGEPSI